MTHFRTGSISLTVRWLLRFSLLYDWLLLLSCALSRNQNPWPALWIINSDLQNTTLVKPLLRKRHSMLQCSRFLTLPCPWKPQGMTEEGKKTETDCTGELKKESGIEKRRIGCNEALSEGKWRRRKSLTSLEYFHSDYFFWPIVIFTEAQTGLTQGQINTQTQIYSYGHFRGPYSIWRMAI